MNPSLGPTLRRFLKLPPMKWAKAAAKLSSADKMDIAHAMENDLERLALAANYLSCLAYGADHARAQRESSKRLAKVRKALGYTYPEQGVPKASW